LGTYGIRCNAVLPGTIKTERWYEMGDKQIVDGELTPIGDISDFDDIANAVWFLGTDMSKNITGAEIIVDGGMSAQLFPQILREYKQKLQGYDR
jgi:L-rhamnose 1-dehydrogenase